MEARETWDCVEKSFQVTVTYDSTPNDNSWISFGFISPPPPLPPAILWPKNDSFRPTLLKIQLYLSWRGGVASFTNITGKVPTPLTSIGIFEFLSVWADFGSDNIAPPFVIPWAKN